MKNCHTKNIFSILGTIALCVCLAVCVLVCVLVLLPLSVAQADSSMSVVVAPVSNLEGNATAGASSIKLMGDYEFYIPESYYLTNVKRAFDNYYAATYCGFEFFLSRSPLRKRPPSLSKTAYPPIPTFCSPSRRAQLSPQAV